MRQTGTYKTVDELPNLLTKEKPQQTYQSVNELPDLKKKVSGDGLKEPSDGGLSGTTSKTDEIPPITQEELDKQDDVIGKIQEADALSKKTRFWGMGGGGGEVPDFDAIAKSKEIHNQLKGMGYGDNDIELLTKTFSDLPKEAETRSVMQQDGTVAYPYSKKSFLELYKTNPIAAVTKANNVKNFYELRNTAGEAKASEYNKLAYVNDETKPINANIDNFNQLKEKQKELINSSLPKEKRQKALDRVEENSDIILSNIFQDENNAKNYLIGKLQQKDATLKLANPTVMEAEGKVDGDLGKFLLESIAENLDPKNKAENLAFRKYKYSVDLDNAVNSSADLNQAALTFAAEQNPQIKGQLEKLGGTRLPNAYEGEIVNEFLNSPDVIKRAESDPIFAEKYNIAKSNLYFNYPDFAKKEVATKISQAMEDRGMTNWFANIPTKEGTDKLVDDLVRTGKLTEQDKLVYDKQIRDDLGVWQSVKRGVGRIPYGAFIEESPIQTPGLLENTQNAFNKTVHGIARSVEDIINIPAGGEVFSAKERLYNKLQEDASMVNLIPKSTLHEVSMGTGHLAGFVIPMMAGGAALRGVKGAEFISNGLMFEGENKSNALKLFPDDPTKQYAYTAIATAGDMMLGHLIPKGDAAKGISKTLKGDIVDVVNKFTNKEITAAEAKQTLLNKTTSLLGDLAKENTKVAGTITGFGVFHNTLDALFGANNMGAGDIATQAVKDFKSTFLTTPILAAMAVKGRASGIDGKILMEVASNPELYKKVIAEQSALNPELKATEKERLQNLEDAALIKKDLDNTEMNDKQKEEFMVTAINKKILERKAAGITDKTLKQSVLDQAEKHDTNLVLLKSEFGDKEFKDLTPEERDRIEPPKDHTVKTRPSGTEGKFTPVIINKKGEHEVLNKSFDTPEAAKVYGEETVKKRYFDENIKNKKEDTTKTEEELPDLSVPIEGTDKKGVPIGENVPPETKPTDVVDEITVGEMLDKTGRYKGEKGSFYQDGQTVIFKVEGKNKEYELGNIEEVKGKSIKDFEIEHEQSVVKVNEDGSIKVRDTDYVNNFSDPLSAINKDKDGNIVSVNLETTDGKKRTFRGNIAEDIAYQINLKEINKNNETRTEFEQHLNEDAAASKEMDNGTVLETTKKEPVKNNEPVSREKVKPKQKPVAKEQSTKVEEQTKPIVNEETKPEILNPETEGSLAETKPVEGVVETATGEKEPPKEPQGEGADNGDWTHINKKDITDAEDLASKHPFGESESWKNSVKKGLEKLAKFAKNGESLYDVAKNKVNEWAAKVKQEILDDGKSTFNPSDEEIAQMAYHRTMTNKKIAELEPDLTSPIQAVRDAVEVVLSDLEAQKEMVDYVLHNTATTAGRAFNIRQMVSKIDAENGLQVKRMDVIRKQKGQPLSEKQEQEIRDIHDEEIKNQKSKDEYAKKKAEKDFEEAVKLEVDRRMKAKKDKATSDKKDKQPTEKRAKIADKLNEWADKFEKFGKADLPEGTQTSGISIDVQKQVANAMRFVAEGVRDGKKIPEIIKDAVKKFGESVLEHIKGGLRDIGITDREIEGDRQYALNKIKELAEKEKSDMLTKSAVGKGLVRELVNSHIDNGLTGKDIFTELNKDLKEIFPEITEQQVRDAYLKEGEFTLDKKENINKAKVDAKNELRSIAKNETDIADLKAERDLRKREREERQRTDYENKLIAEKKELVDKKALTERQERRLVELNKELERIKQRKEKDAKVINPKDLNRSDKEKAVLEEIKKEKEDWAKEKQVKRDLEVAAKKAQTAAKNEAERLKALTEKRDKLEKGQRDAPKTSTPKVESPAIEQVKAEIKDADKKLRDAESETNRLNKEIQAKQDKLAEHESNIKRAEKGLESIKTNRKKSDTQIDTEISDAETRLKKELNKQGLKLEKGSKAEREQKQKVADSHNQRTDKLIEGIDTKLQDDTLTEQEKTALENAKKILEKSKINPDSKLDIFDAVDKAEKNTELARAELANSDNLADIKHEISRSQIQMGKDKLQTEQDILLQRHKDNLQKKIDENERRLEAGEYVEKEPPRLKTSDAESVRLEIKDRETKNKLNAVGKAAQRAAMTKREKAIDTLQSLYVIGLVGRLSTLAKVGVSAITKQPLNTITSQTFGRLGGVLFPKIENALRGEGSEGWRKEKNRYMAHYGALGKEGMAKLIQKGKENAQKADEAYINAKDKLEDIANQHGKDSKQYKDFEKGEFKKAEDKQKQALLDNVTNSLYEWIGGNSWADAAEVFLHSSAKLEQLLGKGEKEMWNDKTRKEKIMFVLSTSAATHGVLKNFSARAEFAANFVARLENKMKQGIDISSAEEILKTVNESYIAFQRGKYQEDNAITGGFKAGLEGLQRWAEKHPDYKYAADLMAGALKFKNPIIRTPVNIAREAIVEYTLGVPLAIAKYRNSLKDAKVDAKQFDLEGQEMKDHMRKFMDNLPPDKADFIYRAFRKGGFGLGVMALTAMGGIQFGGFFNRDEKRRKKGDDLGVNEVAIGGHKLSHLQAKIFEHTSAFFPALLWSNYDRVRDENLKAGHGEISANLDAAMKDFQGMMDQVPIGNEMQNPLSGVQIPLIGPFLTEYAEATDVDEEGDKIKRKPKGNPLERLWQNIEMKIPGLRQNVPISGERTKTWTDEQKNNPNLKPFIDKDISLPDYNPEKIQTKEVNGKIVEHLSDYNEPTQKKYIEKANKYLEEELIKLKNGTTKIYKDKNGTTSTPTTPAGKKGKDRINFTDLTPEQLNNVIHGSGGITTEVSEKVKKEVLKPELLKSNQPKK